MKINKFVYSSASMVLTCRPDGLSRVDARGIVTSAVLQQMRDDLLVHVQRPLWAWYLRLDSAFFAVSLDRLNAVLDGVASSSPLSACAAIFAGPEATELFQDHARSMAERGIGRRVFTSPDAALLWSEEQARLWRAQSAWQAQRTMADRRRLLLAA